MFNIAFSLLLTEKNFGDSQYHFLFTSDGQQCAAMLVESATTLGFPGESDLFVTQAVLQYVSILLPKPCLESKNCNLSEQSIRASSWPNELASLSSLDNYYNLILI